MKGKVFLDTNIFVYLFDRTAPAKAVIARDVVREVTTTGRGVISYQVVQEFFNVALRRFKQPLSASEAQRFYTSILRPLLSVQSSPALFLRSLILFERHSFSWYDSLIVAAAVESQCSVLYTEDLAHDSRIDSLQIVNPFR